MKLLLLAVLVAVCRNAAAVVPISPVGYGVNPLGLGYPGYAAPLGYARPAYAAPLLARPAIAAPLAYRPALAAPVVAKVAAPVDDYDPNPQYSYAYDIQDALTGDSKNQQETRSGDVVQGSYSLVEPDGTRRIVEYTADPHNGFNAVVHKEPVAVKAVAAAPVGYPGLAYH